MPKKFLLHPIPHTKNVSGGGGGAGEGGGATLGLFWGHCASGGRGVTPGSSLGHSALAFYYQQTSSFKDMLDTSLILLFLYVVIVVAALQLCAGIGNQEGVNDINRQ